MRKLLYFVVLLLLAPLFWTFGREGVRFLKAVFPFDATQWFLAGAFLSLLICLLLLRDRLGFLQVLLHELEHAIVFFLFTFRWPDSMEVTPPNGVTGWVGVNRWLLFWFAPLLSLAPYYFPLLTIPFLLLKALAALAFTLLEMPFPGFLAAALDLLIGLTLTLHILCTLKEFRASQPDIRDLGLIVSFVTTLFLNFLFVLLSITVVTGRYAEFLAYVKSTFPVAVDAYKASFAWLKEHVPPALQALRQVIKGLL